MSRFREALRSGRVLLMDGAMGTELQRAGMRDGECYEHWNLTHPERVRAIHRAYVNAGARCLLTNTFQANPIALEKHGLGQELERINEAAVEIARSVCGPDGYVLADIGPMKTLARNRLDPVFRSLGRADGYLLETWVASLLHLFLDRRLSWESWNSDDLPVLFSLTCAYDSQSGEKLPVLARLEPFARWAEKVGIAGLGVNCGQDMSLDDVVEMIRRYRQVTDLPLFARPNAGTPTRRGDRWVYPLTPDQMAGRLPELLEAGITLFGGCCGTTPEHVAACRPVIDAWNARQNG